MYFYKQKGRQILDMRGDLVLTHNDALVKGWGESAAPASVRNATYVENIPAMGFRAKVRVTLTALNFIWGHDQSLPPEVVEAI